MLPFCTPVVDRYPWSKTTSGTECTAIRILALLMLQKPAFLLVCAIVRFFILMPCKRLKKGSVGALCCAIEEGIGQSKFFSFSFFMIHDKSDDIRQACVCVCVRIYKECIIPYKERKLILFR